MARIKDLLAAIVTSGNSYEDTVRIITAASYSAKSLKGEALASELNWVASQSNYPAMKAVAAQGVVYKKINLKSGVMANQATLGYKEKHLSIAECAQKFLHELQVRGELNYPFIIGNSILFISTIDLDIIMAIAREQQTQDDISEMHKNTPAKSAASVIPPK